ncbi:MAG TPA: YibE/F family protein [Candidatus Dorea intestinavium]|nr:YibE/F family protein [Candidatus Dorea intestinavium]
MILILLVIFVLLLLLVGGDRGVISLVTLVGNILTFLFSIYLMALGINPILITLIACLIISSITLFYQNQNNEKTKAAFISVVSVSLLLLLFMVIFLTRMDLYGLSEMEEQSELSLYYSFNIHINMELILLTVVIICFIGAIMDTAMAVSSGVYEVHVNHPDLKKAELYKSGLSIGADILSTTLNTLFFAYCGEALIMFLYLIKYNYSMVKILNSKAFLLNFTTIVMSAIGCILIIPICAKITATIIEEGRKDGEK